MACEIHIMASAMHTAIFVDCALEVKNAHVAGESAIFDRLVERTKTEANEQRSDRNRQSDESSDFKVQLKIQKVRFLPEWSA